MKKEIEKIYTKKQTIKILKRLVDSLAKGKAFRMQIKGKKVYIPKEPEVEIEYEKGKKAKPSLAGSPDTSKKVFREEKVEIEIKWRK